VDGFVTACWLVFRIRYLLNRPQSFRHMTQIDTNSRPYGRSPWLQADRAELELQSQNVWPPKEPVWPLHTLRTITQLLPSESCYSTRPLRKCRRSCNVGGVRRRSRILIHHRGKSNCRWRHKRLIRKTYPFTGLRKGIVANGFQSWRINEVGSFGLQASHWSYSLAGKDNDCTSKQNRSCDRRIERNRAFGATYCSGVLTLRFSS
jgi:hypothetical protein